MEFGMRVASNLILKEIDNGNNLVLSPLSLHIVLNMLASVSSGRALKQLLRFLECESITQINAQSSRFMELVNGDVDESDDEDLVGDPPLSLLNGVWLDRRFSLKPSFKQLAEDVYKTEAQTVDFENQVKQVTHEINSWAKQVSKGCIDPLVPLGLFTKETIFVLANAVYFNGLWEYPFHDTEDEDFYLLNGETIQVPFMKRSATRYTLGSFDGFKQLYLRYRQGQYKHRYAMDIFLPDKKDGLRELVEKFHSDPNFLLEDREFEEVVLDKLWLPKLKYGYELNARKTMTELGLDILFGDDPELTEIVEASKDQLLVSDILHKCFIDIHERGTIATALTTLPGIGACRLPPPSKISFVADHPFLFTIKEESTDTIIFIGAALAPLPGSDTDTESDIDSTETDTENIISKT